MKIIGVVIIDLTIILFGKLLNAPDLYTGLVAGIFSTAFAYSYKPFKSILWQL